MNNPKQGQRIRAYHPEFAPFGIVGEVIHIGKPAAWAVNENPKLTGFDLVIARELDGVNYDFHDDPIQWQEVAEGERETDQHFKGS